MSPTLRRLLNYLPIPPGGNRAQYLKPSWHKPTPFDQWRSQAPFRPRPAIRTDLFARRLLRRRLVRGLLGGTIALALAWVVLESVRAVL